MECQVGDLVFWLFPIELEGIYFCFLVTEAASLLPNNGNDDSPLQDFGRALRSMTMLQSLREVPRGMEPIDRRQSLERTLFCTAHMHATDPRDRVYCLLSVIHSEKAELIKPDYSKDAAEVFAEVTFAAISSFRYWELGQQLDMLDWVTSMHFRLPDLPTWAVDFSQVRDNRAAKLYNAFYVNDRRKLSVPGSVVDPSIMANPRLSADKKRLHLTGVLLDHIVWTTSASEAGHLQCDPGNGVPATVDVLFQSVKPRDEMYTAYGKSVKRNVRATLCSLYALQKKHEYKHDPHLGRLQALFCWWLDSMGLPSDEWNMYVDLRCFVKGMAAAAEDLSIFTTKGGFLGVAPGILAVGDTLAVIHNCHGPLIFKPRPDGSFGYHYASFVPDARDLESFRLDNGIETTEIVLC